VPALLLRDHETARCRLLQSGKIAVGFRSEKFREVLGDALVTLMRGFLRLD